MIVHYFLDLMYDFASFLTFGNFPNAKKVKASVDEADKEFQKIECTRNSPALRCNDNLTNY